MAYTNDMRHAVRAIKNPTPLHIDVSIKDDQIFLLVSQGGIQQLSKKQQKDFNAYLREVKGIIKLGGGGTPQVVLTQ